MRINSLSKLRLDDNAYLAERSCSIFADIPAEPDTPTWVIKTKLHDFSVQLIEVNKGDKKKSEIHLANEQSDKSYRALHGYLESLTILETPYQASAIYLYNIMEKYGLKTIRKSYSEQIAEMLGLQADFSTEECQTHFAALPAFNALYTIYNADFENLRQCDREYNDYIALHKNDPTGTEVKELFSDFMVNEFADFINYSARYQPETFGEVKEKIQNVIDNIESRMKLRSTMAAKKKEEQEGAEGENPNPGERPAKGSDNEKAND